jgi:RimJ/RimL family protein N-acetyltransferase
MFLEGERVRLRPHELRDAPTMQRWVNEPDIRYFLGSAAFQFSLAKEERIIREASVNDWEHGFHFSVEATDTADGEPLLIGSIGLRNLDPRARHADVGILIGEREYWDGGYGTDAMRTLCRFGFEDLDLHRIELFLTDFNPRAFRSYEKLGFVFEGRQRERGYIGGRYYDFLLMGLLRHEFEAVEAGRRGTT